MKAVATIDWLTFTVKGSTDPYAVAENLLKIDTSLFELKPFGKYGYKQSLSFDTISIFFDPAGDRVNDMGVCVSMSGKGCRHWEQHTRYTAEGNATPFFKLFEVLHISEHVNVSRVDLALDDRAGLLNLDVIADAVRSDNINSHIRRRSITESFESKLCVGKTVYIGAPSSEFRIRIYDKAKEQYKLDQPQFNQHWIRFEIVMRGSNANGFINAVVNFDSLGMVASGILQDKLAFIIRDDVNVSRCSICDWWTNFIDAVQAVKLVTKEEINHKLEGKVDWIINQIAPTLSLISDAKGYFQIKEILEIGANRRSKQQQALLDSYRKSYHIV